MSSDNGYLVRVNDKGQYVLQMYFQSDDSYPPIDDPKALKFDTLQETVDYYGENLHGECASEYGLTIDIKFDDHKLYPPITTEYQKLKYCSYCGPGYRHGDEGCRHGPAQKEENKMQLQLFTRKPLTVEGVQVTEDNIDEVAQWCGGEIHTEPKGRYIKVQVQNPLNPNQTKAFFGCWVLRSNRGFKVYTEAGLRNAFDIGDKDPAATYGEPLFGENQDEGAVAAELASKNVFDQPEELLTTTTTVPPRDQISGKQ